MNKKLVGLSAAALTGLFVVSTSMAPAAARNGGGGGGHGGGGGQSFSGGGGGGGGGRSFSGGGGRSFSGSSGPRVSGNWGGGRVYGYSGRGHGHHHHGHGRRFVAVPFGYSDYYDYGYYDGGCSYEYRRAVATGSRYWWNRYRECID
jgi:hypothetical protein